MRNSSGMPTESDAAEVERIAFPWGRAALLLIVLWATLWAAGLAGGMIGAHVYASNYAPEPPYSTEQLATIERMAPSTYRIATMDMDSWEASVELGRTIARLEGKVIGSLLLLGTWGSIGVVWLWNRQRDRRSQLLFSADFG